jgi:glycosyltransferase involved in cell wall biosynthesis
MTNRVLFEGYNLTLSRGTGIATYARNLNLAAKSAGFETEVLINSRTGLDRRDPTLNEISLFDVIPEKPTIGDHIRTARSYVFGTPFGIKTYRLPKTSVVDKSVPTAIGGFDRIDAAVNFSDRANHHFGRYGRSAVLQTAHPPSLFHATQPIPLTLKGCPNIYTIHDLVPLRLPFATLDDKRHFLKMIRHLCKKADHIVTVSEHSRRDIISLGGIHEDRVTNTYQAVTIPQLAAENQQTTAELIQNAFELEYEKYFLFVGAIEPKKNLSRLIDAYAASGTKLPLVIVGGLGWSYTKDVDKLEEDRFLQYRLADGVLSPARKVRHLSYLPSEQLFALMRGARGLLFPSLYEGFGLPVVEAMQLGTPVVTSNVASLPEIAGDAALLVDPYDTSDISRKIMMLDEDADLRADLRRRGPIQAEKFSAFRYAERVSALYQKILG